MPTRRPSKPFNGGQWTQARMNAFIKGALRQASLRWPPRNDARKETRVSRGLYRCSGFKRRAHNVPASVKIRGVRKNNVFVDHIEPVVDPKAGFVGWDEVIRRMFCEKGGFQVLCRECHDEKTKQERKSR